MSKDLAYHEAVVDYNQRFADFAEGVVDSIEEPTVKKWCASIARQHRVHERRHQRILDRLSGESITPPAAGELTAAEVGRLDAITEEVNA